MNNNITKTFEVGKSYVNQQDVLKGMCSGFHVISRTDKTLEIATSGNSWTRKVRVRVTNGREWVKDGNSPYASPVWA